MLNAGESGKHRNLQAFFTFVKKDTGRKFSLRAEKKKFQSSVWWVRDQLRPENKKDTGGKFSLRPEINYDRKKK